MASDTAYESMLLGLEVGPLLGETWIVAFAREQLLLAIQESPFDRARIEAAEKDYVEALTSAIIEEGRSVVQAFENKRVECLQLLGQLTKMKDRWNLYIRSHVDQSVVRTADAHIQLFANTLAVTLYRHGIDAAQLAQNYLVNKGLKQPADYFEFEKAAVGIFRQISEHLNVIGDLLKVLNPLLDTLKAWNVRYVSPAPRIRVWASNLSDSER